MVEGDELMDDLREFGREFGGIFVSVIVAVAALFFMIGASVRQVIHHFDVSACSAFGRSSGYETKFVDYNIAYWDCLAKTSNGKWISTENLHDVNIEKR